MIADLVRELEVVGVRGTAAQLTTGVPVDCFHGRKAVHNLEAGGAVCLPDSFGERWFLGCVSDICVRVRYMDCTVLFSVELGGNLSQ